MRLLTLRAPQAETLWDEVLPIEAKELPDDLYIREWANKYKDEGLVVIGVHAPEFPFERSVDTVRGVTKNRGIHYPVVIDNNHAVWRAFSNMYWPAPYLADTDGAIRYHHFGEEGYEESERTIQELLVEAGRWSDDSALVSVLGFVRRSSTRLARLEVAGNLRRLRAREELRVSWRRGVERAPRLHRTTGFATQSVGARR